MLYEFKSDDGRVITRNYPMRKAPPLGKVIRVDGVAYRRVLSTPGSVGFAEHDSQDYPRVSRALPRECVGADHVKDGRLRGCPIVTSKQHERELLRRHNYSRDYHHTDPISTAGGLKPPAMPRGR